MAYPVDSMQCILMIVDPRIIKKTGLHRRQGFWNKVAEAGRKRGPNEGLVVVSGHSLILSGSGTMGGGRQTLTARKSCT